MAIGRTENYRICGPVIVPPAESMPATAMQSSEAGAAELWETTGVGHDRPMTVR